MDKTDSSHQAVIDPPTEKTQPTQPAAEAPQGAAAMSGAQADQPVSSEPADIVHAQSMDVAHGQSQSEAQQQGLPKATHKEEGASRADSSTAVRESWITGHPRPLLERLDLNRDRLRSIGVRGAKVAAIVFCAWFTVVLLLIAVYRFVNPPFSTLMAIQWISGTPIKRDWVPLKNISPNLMRAVIVSEDGRFCRHWGIDFGEVAAAIRRMSDGPPRGASTITMQVAKNLFLWPAKSYVRKVIEVPLTYAIEIMWPKQRILEVYLNVAEWGRGIFGAEAASRTYFGTSASRLSAHQAARLAVVLPNPVTRNAGRPGRWTSRRASIIQRRAAGNRSAADCVLTGR